MNKACGEVWLSKPVEETLAASGTNELGASGGCAHVTQFHA